MLLMNLKTNENERKLSLPVQLSLFGFLVFSLVVTHAEKRPVTPRFLEIEEKEVVVSVFDRLRLESPDFADSVSVLEDRLADNSVTTLVDPNYKSENLIRRNNRTLIFSSRFFESDQIAQEKSLLRIMSELGPVPGRTGEIAVESKHPY